MIKRLKIRFVALCMSSLFILLFVLVMVMNFVNYSAVVAEADSLLNMMQNDSIKPDGTPLQPPPDGSQQIDPMPTPQPFPDDPKLPYEAGYFSVLLTEDGQVSTVDLRHVTVIYEQTAGEYASSAFESLAPRGFVKGYRYIKSERDGGIRIVFLDCTRQLNAYMNFFTISLGISFAGFALVFLVITVMAKRIMKPIIDSYEKQKRFITDAGHEIKTPLTIINANVDIIEMEMGENECLADIRQQTQRLTALTNDLVYLARIEEDRDSVEMSEFSVSEVVSKIASSFKAPAVLQNKSYSYDIQPLLTMRGNMKYITQLSSILLDNAIKYSPEGGEIRLILTKQGRSILLSVENTTTYEIKREFIKNIFDRFYRPDPSRNSETGGHGIGLSVASAIVELHQGKIQATSDSPRSFKITAVLPQ